MNEAARRIAARHYPLDALVSVAAIMAALGSGSVQAAVFTVTNKNDAGPGSLRDAVAQANAAAGADAIHFDPKLKGVITLKTGEIDITGPLTIHGLGAKVLTVSGNNASRIFDINYPAAMGATAINGLTLARGRTTGHGGAVQSVVNTSINGCVLTGNATTGDNARGGAIHLTLNDLSVLNSTISGNTTSGSTSEGGGISFYDGGTLTLSGTSVSGNSTTGADANGGGVNARIGDVVIIDSSISGNSTGGGSATGGGLAVVNGEVSISDSVISGNSTTGGSSDGGGIYVDMGTGTTLTGSIVSGNSTAGSGSSGGGLFLNNAGVLLINSTISGNSTAGSASGGGGLYVKSDDMTLLGSTVSGNSTSGLNSRGGGLYAYQGNATVTNSTISGNTTTGDNASGGGMRVFPGTAVATLRNNTFALNRATGTSGQGDALAGVMTLHASNNIFAQADPSDVACSDTIDTGGGNLATDGSCGPNSATTMFPFLNLGGLADNGGLTKTHALLGGSNAIDAGSDAVCNTGNPGPSGQDQRGVSRSISGGCDIGAYELNPSAPPLACPLVAPSCLALPAASLSVKRGKAPKLTFSASGDTTGDAALFGNPKTGTGNLLCVYQGELLDAQYRVPSPITSLLWKFDTVKGIATYSERFGIFDGVTNVKQTPGAKGKLSWTVKGDSTLDLRLPAALPVRVQNQNSDGGCVEALFDNAAHVAKNDDTALTLKRKAP